MSAARRDRGALALVLHSHMPYVEGFGTWPFGEEWLWEAVATVYLPLLDVLEQRPAALTVGLTPVLCDQLEAMRGPAGRRFVSFLREVRAPIHEEDAAGLDRGGEPALAAEVRRAAADYRDADAAFARRGGDLVGAFAALAAHGPIELIASPATHAVLPLLATSAGLGLQVGTGTAAHERRFGAWPGGFWLPECAYAPGLERDLAGHGVRAFCVDQTAAFGAGADDHLTPVATAAGPVAVPIDWDALGLVWTRDTGYPAHPAYRDYHRRTTHDLRPWSNAGTPYDSAAAAALAREHAADFVARAVDRLDRHRERRGRPALLCCALDTELVGHWWYEGPAWLRAVVELAPAAGLELVTLSEGARAAEPVERPLAPSTWAVPRRDLSTWDGPPVADIAFAARRREVEVATAAAAAAPRGRAALERAARELLALQSSDWAFQVTHRLAADYPRRRAAEHAEGVAAALAALAHCTPDPEPALRHLAPQLDLSPLLAP